MVLVIVGAIRVRERERNIKRERQRERDLEVIVSSCIGVVAQSCLYVSVDTVKCKLPSVRPVPLSGTLFPLTLHHQFRHCVAQKKIFELCFVLFEEEI